MITETDELVTYLFPTEESHKQMEWEARDSWRVFDGVKWKFQLATREQAAERCKKLGGTHIGYAVWNDETEMNDYRNVEVIK